MASKPLKLTALQREILQAMAAGGIITIDSMNLAKLGERDVQPQTRYFLTQHRLITAVDKSRAITTKGNGFTISDKGRQALARHI